MSFAIRPVVVRQQIRLGRYVVSWTWIRLVWTTPNPAGTAMSGSDDTTICEACGREFIDEVAWQEHYEDQHLDDDDPVPPGPKGKEDR